MDNFRCKSYEIFKNKFDELSDEKQNIIMTVLLFMEHKINKKEVDIGNGIGIARMEAWMSENELCENLIEKLPHQYVYEKKTLEEMKEKAEKEAKEKAEKEAKEKAEEKNKKMTKKEAKERAQEKAEERAKEKAEREAKAVMMERIKSTYDSMIRDNSFSSELYPGVLDILGIDEIYLIRNSKYFQKRQCDMEWLYSTISDYDRDVLGYLLLCLQHESYNKHPTPPDTVDAEQMPF